MTETRITHGCRAKPIFKTGYAGTSINAIVMLRKYEANCLFHFK